MRAAVGWRIETREACQIDIVDIQIRIELNTPDACGKDKQDNGQKFTPCGFFEKRKT